MPENHKNIGRNEPCPCGSGNKFKKCHGKPQNVFSPQSNPVIDAEIIKQFQQINAADIQRTQQQGLGRPIISTLFNGYRFVAVGSQMYWNKQEKWQSFVDFLYYYIRTLFGQEWANVELKKSHDSRHALLIWNTIICEEQKKYYSADQTTYCTPVNGAMHAFLTLAYNLYLVAHNIHLVQGTKLHDRLIERLKDSDTFYPAFYETMVVAAFVKAGFKVILENEGDITCQHAEFIAESKKTGTKYSVEAKSRQPGKEHTVIRNQLYNALKKDLPHKRVVFIDLNIPENMTGDGRVKWLDDVLGQIRKGEQSFTVDGNPAPEAYVFVTNYPFLYNLESYQYPPAVVAEGYKIPDFKIDSAFRDLREALDSRDRHIDMLNLLKAMKEYDVIPLTFDGNIPEYAFGDISTPRLIVGQKYMVPDSDGREVEAELVDCTVMETEKRVYCIHRLVSGNTITCAYDLSDIEYQAFKRHPDTYFGVYKKHRNEAKDALDLYDFFYQTYKHSSKDKLLSFLKDHPDIKTFQSMTQQELAKAYCEITACVAFREAGGLNKENH
jgi:hypothetical protein